MRTERRVSIASEGLDGLDTSLHTEIVLTYVMSSFYSHTNKAVNRGDKTQIRYHGIKFSVIYLQYSPESVQLSQPSFTAIL